MLIIKRTTIFSLFNVTADVRASSCFFSLKPKTERLQSLRTRRGIYITDMKTSLSGSAEWSVFIQQSLVGIQETTVFAVKTPFDCHSCCNREAFEHRCVILNLRGYEGFTILTKHNRHTDEQEVFLKRKINLQIHSALLIVTSHGRFSLAAYSDGCAAVETRRLFSH